MMEAISRSIYVNLIYDDRYKFLLDGLKMTLLLTIGSFILGSLIAVVFTAIQNSRLKVLRGIVGVIRGLFVKLPTLVLLMVFVYIVFGSVNIDVVSAAIITFSLKTAAYLTDVFYSALKSVDEGEVEAARTLGLSGRMAFFQIVFPQAVKQALPLYRNQFILTMQETSVVSLLAIMDLTRATSVISTYTMDPYLSIIVSAVAYLAIGAAANLILRLLDNSKHISKEEAEA